MREYIIAVDFDGTIVKHDFPDIGKLKPGAKEALQNLHSKGIKIIIWTCRDGEYLEEMERFLKAEGIPFDAVNENLPSLGFKTSQKIYADLYIDDRSLLGAPNQIVSWRTIENLVLNTLGGAGEGMK